MISYRMPPAYSGAGMQALRLAQTLSEKGLEMSAVTARTDLELPSVETVNGVAIHRVPVLARQRFGHLSFFLSAAVHVLRHRDQYDIIHLHGAYRRAIPIVAAARLANLKTVVKMSMMGTDDPATTREWLFGGLLMKALAHADAVVAITEELAQSYLQAGLPEEHLVRIPNGVDTSRFHPVDPPTKTLLRKQLGLPLDAPVVLFVGVVNRRKGVDLLLEAWPQVGSEFPDAILVLVGPLPMSSGASESGIVRNVQAAAQQDRIKVLGQQPAVERFYQAADVFVLPTRREGLPNALLEAMACRLPVVASSLPGVSQVVTNGNEGLLLTIDDSAALSSAISRVLGDVRMAQKLATAAERTIEAHYALRGIADRYSSLYRALLYGERVRQ